MYVVCSARSKNIDLRRKIATGTAFAMLARRKNLSTEGAREHLVLIRPVEDLLEMTMLHYKSEIRDADLIPDNLHDVKIAPQELKLAEQLIEASTTEDFDFGEYQDHYTDRLRTLIDSKIKGKDIKVPKNNDRAPATINLMEALMKSVKAKKDRTPKPSRIQRRKSS